MIVVGGGRKEAQTWQESPELNRIARIAIAIHDDLEKIKLKDKDDRDFYFSGCGQRKVLIHL